MQRERQWLTLPVATLDAYAGRYKGPNAVVVITREGDTLVLDRNGQRLVLKPTAENVFFARFGGEWTFYRIKRESSLFRFPIQRSGGACNEN